jgi:hypothetical protein
MPGLRRHALAIPKLDDLILGRGRLKQKHTQVVYLFRSVEKLRVWNSGKIFIGFHPVPVFIRCLVHLVIFLLLLDLLNLVLQAFLLCVFPVLVFPPLTFPASHPEVLLKAEENEQDLQREDDPAGGIEHHPFWVLPMETSVRLYRALPPVACLLIEADISLAKGTLRTTAPLSKVGLIRLISYSNCQQGRTYWIWPVMIQASLIWMSMTDDNDLDGEHVVVTAQRTSSEV